MISIKGKFNTANIYTDDIEEEALKQILNLCNLEFLSDCKIAIMPDVHAGKGCTIGTTMTIKDKAIPNVVGVDIGCGMYTVKLGKVDINLQELDEVCHKIPSGRNVWEGRICKFDELQELKCYRNLKDTKRLVRSLGTLGGGNHFIEVDEASDGTKYLVIHSGSRNLGKQVAEHYQRLAIDLNKGKEDYFRRKDEIIANLKKEGRKLEIEKELKKLKFEAKPLSVPEEVCYVYGQYFDDYLCDIKICQKFALLNRELIANVILEKLQIKALDSFHTIHNYIDTDAMILRKGSIRALKDEMVLIPINMRDGSILAKGLGNPDYNYSAPHGAGRKMSRTAALNSIGLEEFKKSMEGIYTTSVNESTIDESPMAYKSLDDIISNIKETVNVIEVIKPIYNFKASN